MFIPTNLIPNLSIALPSPPRLTILLMSYQVLRASTKIPCMKEALLFLLVGGGRKRGIYLFLFLLLLILPSSLPPCLLRKGGGGRGEGGGGKRIPLKNLCSSSSRVPTRLRRRRRRLRARDTHIGRRSEASTSPLRIPASAADELGPSSSSSFFFNEVPSSCSWIFHSEGL